MKTMTFEAVAESAYGKKLASPIKYSGEYEAYLNMTEIMDKNDFPKDQEIVDFRNTQRKANARQKALQTALDAAGIIKPTLENDEQMRLQNMFKILVAAGKSEAEAKAIAAATLGVEWAE